MTSATYQDYEDENRAVRSADALGSDQFLDPLELIYKFIFTPNSEFFEIDKLWSLTYLTEEDCRAIILLAQNIRIYDQAKFYVDTIQLKKIGETKETRSDGMVVITPKYEAIHISESRFCDLMRKDWGRIQAICAAAGGRKGALMRAMRTTGLERHDSLEDKTAPPSRWSMMGSKRREQQGR